MPLIPLFFYSPCRKCILILINLNSTDKFNLCFSFYNLNSIPFSPADLFFMYNSFSGGHKVKIIVTDKTFHPYFINSLAVSLTTLCPTVRVSLLSFHLNSNFYTSLALCYGQFVLVFSPCTQDIFHPCKSPPFFSSRVIYS